MEMRLAYRRDGERRYMRNVDENIEAISRIVNPKCGETAAIPGWYEEWDDGTNIIDLLTDLRHYCNRKGVEFDYVLHVSEIHYRAEISQGRNGAIVRV